VEVGCEIEESFQDTMTRLMCGHSFQKKKGFSEFLVLCNTLKDLLRMLLNPPRETIKDDAMIQIEMSVPWRGKSKLHRRNSNSLPGEKLGSKGCGKTGKVQIL